MSESRAQRIFLVRHGETEWSKTGRHTGRTDVPLSDTGRRMAALVGRALAGIVFTRVFFSPLSRAAETCRIAGFGDIGQARPELMEWNYGQFEGLTTAEIRRQDPDWTVWTGPVPGGEMLDDVVRRCDHIIAEAREVDGDVAMFGHGHCLRVLGARWLGLEGRDGRMLLLDTATISILGYERIQPVLCLWNSSGHLKLTLD